MFVLGQLDDLLVESHRLEGYRARRLAHDLPLDLEADEYFTRLNEAMADPATIRHFFWYELGASPLPHPAGSLAPTLRLHL